LKLGVLGGTFDPVHAGHLALAEGARRQLRLEKVLLIPAGQPWRKAGRAVSAAEHRVAMLRLAAAGNPGLEVSTVEVDRPGPTYTVETLAKLKDEWPNEELVLILGEDALADLPNWRDADRIREFATLAVARRSEGDRAVEIATAAGMTWLTIPRIEISASAIRERVRAGLPVRDLVPEAVAEYIDEHGMYRQ